MKGLLIKDFRLMKSQGRSMTAILVLGVVMNLAMENYGFTIGYMGFIGATLAVGTISYDEYDNGNAFLFSLPITRRGYVTEKYVFGLLFGGGGWLLGTAGALIMGRAKGSSSMEESIMAAMVVLPMIALMLAMMLPIQLKFGAEKGRVIRIGVMMLLFAMIILSARLAERWKLSPGALPVFNPEMLAAVGIVIVPALLLLSWKISVSVVKKKEF